MKIPREAQQIARKLYQICLDADGSLNPQTVKSTVDALLKERPRFVLQILYRLRELCRLHLAKTTAVITSAHQVGQQQDAVKSQIRSHYPFITDMRFEIDPSLIAGLRIQIGSNVWDGSIKQKLKQLQESLSY